MSEHIEFDPVDRITVGAVGDPGERVFMLQASRGPDLRTWVLEKEHVMALGGGSYALLAQLGEQEMTREILGKSSAAFSEAMDLQPDDVAFRIDPGTMALGYDDTKDMILISFAELSEEEAAEKSTARLWVSRRQLAALGVHGMAVVAAGRPVCPLCGQILEGDHKCPPHVFNGHSKKTEP
ncbi:MAG: DUF3090 family protein [Actinomycetota bacterium]